jgi:transposase-like protein
VSFSEESCIKLFVKLYYFNIILCNKCESDLHVSSKLNSFKAYQCNKCNASFSVFTNTPFANTHVPIQKWLYAFCLITSSHKRITARQLSISISVSYKTAWKILYKLRRILKTPSLQKFVGVLLEMNDTIMHKQPTILVISE